MPTGSPEGNGLASRLNDRARRSPDPEFTLAIENFERRSPKRDPSARRFRSIEGPASHEGC